MQVQLLLRLLLPTAVAISISGITRRANRYSTQIAAVYLHVAGRCSTSTSGITRGANRYSTQIAAVLACSRPLFDKHQRYNPKSEPLFDTDCSGILACSIPLFDKHQQHNAKSGPLLFQSIAQRHNAKSERAQKSLREFAIVVSTRPSSTIASPASADGVGGSSAASAFIIIFADASCISTRDLLA